MQTAHHFSLVAKIGRLFLAFVCVNNRSNGEGESLKFCLAAMSTPSPNADGRALSA